ncbi:hypothetical protein [Geodermatophilus pulveris]|uniref:hypothetical protein n=1 Tax=Geodermatophilus pulveris TaxID=1564159 RepID=UPI000B794B66|nr:hypothetical protein [Geodermatophilus pulveris]
MALATGRVSLAEGVLVDWAMARPVDLPRLPVGLLLSDPLRDRSFAASRARESARAPVRATSRVLRSATDGHDDVPPPTPVRRMTGP